MISFYSFVYCTTRLVWFERVGGFWYICFFWLFYRWKHMSRVTGVVIIMLYAFGSTLIYGCRYWDTKMKFAWMSEGIWIYRLWFIYLWMLILWCRCDLGVLSLHYLPCQRISREWITLWDEWFSQMLFMRLYKNWKDSSKNYIWIEKWDYGVVPYCQMNCLPIWRIKRCDLDRLRYWSGNMSVNSLGEFESKYLRVWNLGE